MADKAKNGRSPADGKPGNVNIGERGTSEALEASRPGNEELVQSGYVGAGDFPGKASPGAPANKSLTPATQNKGGSVEVNATDGARELAEAEGVDLSTVKGTGEGGRITKADVQDAIDKK